MAEHLVDFAPNWRNSTYKGVLSIGCHYTPDVGTSCSEKVTPFQTTLGLHISRGHQAYR
jgi:hypothetical protein